MYVLIDEPEDFEEESDDGIPEAIPLIPILDIKQ